MRQLSTLKNAKFYLPLVAALGLGACGEQSAPIDSEVKSICGPTNDMQEVEEYDGTLGVSKQFVFDNEGPVGAMTNSSGRAFCSGTLISENLFLTAGHCIGGSVDSVVFNYQVGKTRQRFAVEEVLERGSGLDYAILKLEGLPGLTYGFAAIDNRRVRNGETIAIIQHPSGTPKKIEVGALSGSSRTQIRYSGLDTLGGSSGSGVLDAAGNLVGVHSLGGCSSRGGSNAGTYIGAIVDASDILPL